MFLIKTKPMLYLCLFNFYSTKHLIFILLKFGFLFHLHENIKVTVKSKKKDEYKWTSEMGSWVKALVSQSNNIGSIPGLHMVEEGTKLS